MRQNIVQVYVWSKKIRLFHGLNVLLVFTLIALGLVIFNAKVLGISSDGKVLLKTVHVLVGYVFAINLFFRILVAFSGKGVERFSQMLPFTKAFRDEVRQLKHNKTHVFKGHNPLGKLMVAALLATLVVQMASGLVLAGTDIYYPPLGGYVLEHIAQDKQQLERIKPYSKDNVNQAAYEQMRAFRKPFISAHVYAFYTLLLLIPLHIIGVIVAERRERSSLISAMVHGYKYLPEDPGKQGIK
jgi:cytochrome b